MRNVNKLAAKGIRAVIPMAVDALASNPEASANRILNDPENLLNRAQIKAHLLHALDEFTSEGKSILHPNARAFRRGRGAVRIVAGFVPALRGPVLGAEAFIPSDDITDHLHQNGIVQQKIFISKLAERIEGGKFKDTRLQKVMQDILREDLSIGVAIRRRLPSILHGPGSRIRQFIKELRKLDHEKRKLRSKHQWTSEELVRFNVIEQKLNESDQLAKIVQAAFK